MHSSRSQHMLSSSASLPSVSHASFSITAHAALIWCLSAFSLRCVLLNHSTCSHLVPLCLQSQMRPSQSQHMLSSSASLPSVSDASFSITAHAALIWCLSTFSLRRVLLNHSTCCSHLGPLCLQSQTRSPRSQHMLLSSSASLPSVSDAFSSITAHALF